MLERAKRNYQNIPNILAQKLKRKNITKTIAFDKNIVSNAL